MTTEQWLPVVGFEGLYEVSDLGRVRSLGRTVRAKGGASRRVKGKMLIGSRNRDGYVQIGFINRSATARSGGLRRMFVHRVVLEAFVGPCPDGMEACHNNGVPSENRLSNLRWDSPRRNNADKLRHGTAQRGEKHPNAKLTDIDVERIFDMRRNGSTRAQIAQWLGCHRMTVSKVLRRQIWSHVQICGT